MIMDACQPTIAHIQWHRWAEAQYAKMRKQESEKASKRTCICKTNKRRKKS